MMGISAAFRNGSGEGGITLGAEAVFFYLVTYAFMTLGTFGVIIALSSRERPIESVDDLAGLSRSHPVWAFGLAVCLFSLAGIPPLAGFWGKLQIFLAVLSVARGADRGPFVWLAVIGGVNAAIGACYYLRIVVRMYLGDEPSRIAPRAPAMTKVAVAVCVAATILLGVIGGPIASLAHEAARGAMAPMAATAVGRGR
jgi:NADH-quinone oxidoreductase subunit N